MYIYTIIHISYIYIMLYILYILYILSIYCMYYHIYIHMYYHIYVLCMYIYIYWANKQFTNLIGLYSSWRSSSESDHISLSKFSFSGLVVTLQLGPWILRQLAKSHLIPSVNPLHLPKKKYKDPGFHKHGFKQWFLYNSRTMFFYLPSGIHTKSYWKWP